MRTLQQAPEGGAVTVPDDHDFDAWVAARGEALLRLAYVLTGGRCDAEDVVQEALSKALVRWDRIRQLDDPDAYVRRMVVNAHTSWWRKVRRREVPVAEVDGDDPLVAPASDAAVTADEHRRLWAACQALTDGQRTALVLRYYEELEYAEIAALTGLREASVRARVSRGMAALRRELGEDGG